MYFYLILLLYYIIFIVLILNEIQLKTNYLLFFIYFMLYNIFFLIYLLLYRCNNRHKYIFFFEMILIKIITQAKIKLLLSIF